MKTIEVKYRRNITVLEAKNCGKHLHYYVAEMSLIQNNNNKLDKFRTHTEKLVTLRPKVSGYFQERLKKYSTHLILNKKKPQQTIIPLFENIYRKLQIST